MKLADIMTPKVVTVEKSNSLWEVKMIFENTKFHHLLVTDNNQLVGMLSDRDYLKAVSPKLGTKEQTASDTESLNQRVHSIMKTDLHTLNPDSSLFDAMKLFNDYSISCIPIIDNSNQIEGILSWRDIFKMIYKKQLENNS
jgi:acetoin utilization protein AcuB